MPIDLAPFLEPRGCALVVFECQENVVGASSQLPGLVAAVEAAGMLARVARLLECARAAGAGIFYCTAEQRDGRPGSAKTPLMDRLARSAGAEPADPSVVQEVAPQRGDVVIARSHGMTGFHDTGLDACLRDREARTVIPVGVSLNVGIVGTAIEAVNRGYRVIVPTDCVAADPPEYAEPMLRYTIRNIAYVTQSEAICEAWRAA